ncbi:MAG: RDD family protein [Smithella sp.]|jgi:uncharacterized RDD family membrane protein YckC
MTFYRYAGFWRRLIAFTLDGTIIFFVFVILFAIAALAYFFGAVSANGEEFLAGLAGPSRVSPAMILLWILYTFIHIAYFTYFHGTTGRTPGKMLLSLQVVSDDGSPISFGTAFLRTVSYFISNIFYLGFIWVAFDKRKQGWHDKIARTVVIIKEKVDQSSGMSISDNSPSGTDAQTTKPPENNDN